MPTVIGPFCRSIIIIECFNLWVFPVLYIYFPQTSVCWVIKGSPWSHFFSSNRYGLTYAVSHIFSDPSLNPAVRLNAVDKWCGGLGSQLWEPLGNSARTLNTYHRSPTSNSFSGTDTVSGNVGQIIWSQGKPPAQNKIKCETFLAHNESWCSLFPPIPPSLTLTSSHFLSL